ncbi:hypothetical protein HDU67_004622, partial [Dinochytrium kinnereticum]
MPPAPSAPAGLTDYSPLITKSIHLWSSLTDPSRQWHPVNQSDGGSLKVVGGAMDGGRRGRKHPGVETFRIAERREPMTVTAFGFVDGETAGSPVTVENVAAVISSMEARSAWDTMFESFDVIERVDSQTSIIKATMKKAGFLS